MPINKENYFRIVDELNSKRITLVAVSKTKPAEDILELYELGQRDFGENYVQELFAKYEQLPKDIRWHFIGHLQSNKVKYIAPFVHLIHGIDSAKLLKEVNRQAQKLSKQISVLLQVHIAQEETKFGLAEYELDELLGNTGELSNVKVEGLMGMASFTENKEEVRKEFQFLRNLFNKYSSHPSSNNKLQTLSMGMSSDYEIAMQEGSTMIRIGSLLFGERV